MNNIIYAFLDPISKEVRYIGKSKQGLKRPKQQLCPSMLEPYTGNKNLTHKQSWIKSVLDKDLKPEIIVLASFESEEQLNDAEIKYIAILEELKPKYTYTKVINCRDEVFNSMKEAAKKYGVSHSNIAAVCKGRKNSAGKYEEGNSIKWKYYKQRKQL